MRRPPTIRRLPHLRRAPVLLMLAAAALVLAACGSGGGTATSSSGASSGGSSLPSVAHATDVKVEPLPSAGPSPAPRKLVTKDLVVGSGAEAKATSTVKVQYVGADYANAKVFDASWTRGQAATFSLSQVVPGFAQGIVGMKVGGRRLIVIPPKLGYGSAGEPPAVGPNETLTFVVDLLAVS